MARRVAESGAHPDAGDRPLLLQVDLLPRAERRPLRDRDHRPGLRHGRAARARSASASRCPPNYEHLRERLEPCSRRSRIRAQSAPASDELDQPRAPRPDGEPEGAARPLPRPRRRRARPLPAARRARPGAAPARRHAARAALAAAGRRALVRGARDRLSRSGDRSCRRSRPSASGSTSLAETTGIRPERDGARRLLAGRGDDVRARPRTRTPAAGGADRPERLHPDRRRASSSTSTPPLPPVAIGHGTFDPVISVEWGRRARELLEAAGAEVHLPRVRRSRTTIDPRFLVELERWLSAALAAPAPPAS